LPVLVGVYTLGRMNRILVVDDEEWVRQLVQGYLEQAGFNVATAADGTGALAKFNTYRPDLVVLDWMLPGLDETGGA